MLSSQKNSNTLQHDPYLALRNEKFVKLLSARFLFTCAYQIASVVIGWQLFDLTHDPLSLGFVGLAEALGYIGVALYAGQLVDRSIKKHILSFALLIFLLAMAIPLLISLIMSSGQKMETLPIAGFFYLSAFVTGLTRGFYAPSGFALMGLIVPKASFLNASTWNSSLWQISSILGPALGGAIYAWKGSSAAYFSSMVLTLLAFWAIRRIEVLEKHPQSMGQSGESLQQRVLAGLKFVFDTKILLWAMSLDMFAVLFGGAVALLPIFAKDILKVGPTGLGLLRAAPSFGSALMGIALAYLPQMKRPGEKMLLAVGGFALCSIGLGLSTNFYLSLFFLAASGACDNISVIVRHTILQMSTPEQMRGRVSSVSTIFISSSNEIGAFESGVTAKWMGAVGSVLFGGVMSLGIVAVAWAKGQVLRQLDFAQLSEEKKKN